MCEKIIRWCGDVVAFFAVRFPRHRFSFCCTALFCVVVIEIDRLTTFHYWKGIQNEPQPPTGTIKTNAETQNENLIGATNGNFRPGELDSYLGFAHLVFWRLALRIGWSQLNLSDHEKSWQSLSAWPLDQRAADLLAYAIPPRLCFETGAV